MGWVAFDTLPQLTKMIFDARIDISARLAYDEVMNKLDKAFHKYTFDDTSREMYSN
jgi:hypothetical protein